MISSQRFRSPYPAMQESPSRLVSPTQAHRAKWSRAHHVVRRSRPSNRPRVRLPAFVERAHEAQDGSDGMIRASQTRCEGGPCRRGDTSGIRLRAFHAQKGRSPPSCAASIDTPSSGAASLRLGRREVFALVAPRRVDKQAFGDMHGGIGPCSQLFGELVNTKAQIAGVA